MNRVLYWSVYGGGLLLAAMLIVAAVMAVFGVVPFRSAQPLLAAGHAAGGAVDGPHVSPSSPAPVMDPGHSDGWDAVWQARPVASGVEPEPAARVELPVDDGGAPAGSSQASLQVTPHAVQNGLAPGRQRRVVRTAPDTTIPPEPVFPEAHPEMDAGARPTGGAPLLLAGLWPMVQPDTMPDPPPADPADDPDTGRQDDDGGAGGGDGADLPPPQDAPPGPLRLSLVPGHEEVAPGEVVSVGVVLSEADRISSVPFHVRFNSEVLEYVGAKSGPAITGSPVQPILLAAVNPARPDDLAVGLALLPSSGRFSGSGTVVVLDFRALRAGDSELLLERASVRDAHSRPLTVQIESSVLTVR